MAVLMRPPRKVVSTSRPAINNNSSSSSSRRATGDACARVFSRDDLAPEPVIGFRGLFVWRLRPIGEAASRDLARIESPVQFRHRALIRHDEFPHGAVV